MASEDETKTPGKLAEIHGQTAKIAWRELERFFAGGKVFYVHSSLDLVGVATALAEDSVEQVNEWMESGTLRRVDDEQAQQWHAQDVDLWAVVVAPWILVQ